MLFEFDSLKEQKARIRVIGVGGAGSNAIDRMVDSELSGVEFIAVNTDAQALDNSKADVKIQIGKTITKGLGAGAKLHVGEAAAEEDAQAIAAALDGSDLVFVTAGMGGGTGTGAAPVVARISKEIGALTIGIVTTPFRCEGPQRSKRGKEGVENLRQYLDTLIVIPNQRLLSIVERTTSMVDAFLEADSVLLQATRGISDLINVPGLINLDYADVKTTMEGMGDAIMGTGIASGEERAVLAAQTAISSPLLDDTNINGAQGLLINITGGPNMSLFEVDEAANLIFEEVGEQANIIMGAVIDETMGEELRVTVIATGFHHDSDLKFDHKETQPARVYRPAAPMAASKPVEEIVIEAPVQDFVEPKIAPRLETFEDRKKLEVPTYERQQSEPEDVIMHFSDDLSVPTYIRRQEGMTL
ncbi:MAG: cell division protein FtsZ [FCB group bacterium]|nr:cell division protein FtsZ [FCB group bacterium]MBL7026881.1 cell division protein FtsZ [Candidatus Neomarinimicrobiota bacterium]MBL7121458.1 cell division protein FtsZ [Candidatus Neomarinimicrobiota bacterium]